MSQDNFKPYYLQDLSNLQAFQPEISLDNSSISLITHFNPELNQPTFIDKDTFKYDPYKIKIEMEEPKIIRPSTSKSEIDSICIQLQRG